MTLVSRAISSELLHARVPTRSFFARFNATSLSDRVRRVGRARTVGAVHDDPSLDESQANALAVNAHPATDRPHRDARSGEAHSLRLLVEAEPRSTARHVATPEVREHRGAVDAVPFGQRLDAHPGQVVTDERVHLGGGEKSLSRLDSPHDGPPIIPRSAALGPLRDLVNASQKAVDQGSCLWGRVAERAT